MMFVRRFVLYVQAFMFICYMYGYCLYYMVQGKDPIREYERQCQENGDRLMENLAKTEKGQELVQLLREQAAAYEQSQIRA